MPSFTHWLKNAQLKLGLALLLIALIGIPLVPHYGLSVDEGTEIAMVRRNIEFVTQGKPIPGDLKYFGTFFNVIAEGVFQAQAFVKSGFSLKNLNYTAQLNTEADRLAALRARVDVKHYVTFLFSGLTYLAVAGLVAIFCSWEWAWLGVLGLALMPIHWGHSFFNPKDPPFAAMFTLASWAGAHFLAHCLEYPHQNRRTFLYSILYGALLGFTSGVRIGGAAILGFIALTYVGLAWPGKRRFIWMYGILVAVWFGVHALCYPAFWANPVAGFWETYSYLSSHPLQITVLFWGLDIPIQEIPALYLPTWVWLSIPGIFHLGFWGGSVFLLRQWGSLSVVQRAGLLLLWWQVLFLPGLAIARSSPLYDGMRHFLFITPAIVVVTVVAGIKVWQALGRHRFRLFFLGLVIVACGGIIVDMITLHPYQYIYINRLAGGIAGAHQRFDLEVLGLSLREGMEWLNQNAAPNSTVVVGGLLNSARLYAAPQLQVNDLKTRPIEPFYYLSWLRWQDHKRYLNCPIVHQVTRQGVPLAIVRYCSN